MHMYVETLQGTNFMQVVYMTKMKSWIPCNNVDVPNSESNLKWTPMFEWCMVVCRFKNRHKKVHVFKRDKIIVFMICWLILISIVFYDHSKRIRHYNLIVNKVFHMSPTNHEDNDYGHDLIWSSSHINCMCLSHHTHTHSRILPLQYNTQ